MNKILSLFAVFLLLVSTAFASPVFVQEFYGDLTINGSPASVDTDVRAMIGGVDRTKDSYSTAVEGKYGSQTILNPKFQVQGDVAGQTINFEVKVSGNWVEADQSAVYVPGATTQLDLILTTTACSLNSDCDDNNYCNGAETCNAGVCTDGTPIVCDDTLYCNGLETCNEATDSCDAGTAVVCDDTLYCNGLETCNEATDSCDAGTAVVCDDTLYCNGLETCNEGTDACDAGTTVVCDDAEVCTDDSCNEGTDSCDYEFDETNDPVCLAVEVCDNQIDDDGDTLVDCDDSDCSEFPACIPPPVTEDTCDDQVDNDGDTFIDCDDSDCSEDPYCAVAEVCDNQIDDDLDSLIDCHDPDCDGIDSCELDTELTCDDAFDNDGDGLVDEADPDCCTDNLFTVNLNPGWNMVSLALDPTFPAEGYTADSLCAAIEGCDTVAWLDTETQIMHDNVGPEDTAIVGGFGYFVHVSESTDFGVCGTAWTDVV